MDPDQLAITEQSLVAEDKKSKTPVHTYTALVNLQREYFRTGETRHLNTRLHALRNLQASLKEHEAAILRALHEDLGKNPTEAYMTELGQVRSELGAAIKHLKKWMQPQKVGTPLSAFPAKSMIYSEPLGVVLIFSPWNYPFQLALSPVIAAIAAGNCAIIKPSQTAPATGLVIEKVIKKAFTPELCTVIVGEGNVHSALLAERYDFIFYTGSPRIGHVILEAAAKNLTPVCLELGGKSPVIVTADANIELAAKRVAWGKALNSGQTCIAPDYVWVDRQVQPQFVKALEAAWKDQLGKEPTRNPDYSRLVSEKAFDRLLGLVQNDPPAVDRELLKMAPKAYQAGPDHPLLQDEIFGPLLPILSYDRLDQALDYIKTREKPLALYLFTNNQEIRDRVIREVPFGGGCVNDVVLHAASHNLPFGGVGNSGMGRYHGKAGFDLLSNRKSVVEQGNWPDVPLRYPPFKPGRLSLLKRVLR